jgi:hypothetical protein
MAAWDCPSIFLNGNGQTDDKKKNENHFFFLFEEVPPPSKTSVHLRLLTHQTDASFPIWVAAMVRRETLRRPYVLWPIETAATQILFVIYGCSF